MITREATAEALFSLCCGEPSGTIVAALIPGMARLVAMKPRADRALR